MAGYRDLLLFLCVVMIKTVAARGKKEEFYYMDGAFDQCGHRFNLKNDTVAIVTAWTRAARHTRYVPNTCTLTFVTSHPSMVLKASFSALYLPCSSKVNLHFYDGVEDEKVLSDIHCNRLTIQDITSTHNSIKVKLYRGFSIDYDFKFSITAEKVGLTFGQSSAIIVTCVVVVEVAVVMVGCYIKRRRVRRREEEDRQLREAPAGICVDPPPYSSIISIISSPQTTSSHSSMTSLLQSEEHASHQPPPPYSRDIERLCSVTPVTLDRMSYPFKSRCADNSPLPCPLGVPPPSYTERDIAGLPRESSAVQSQSTSSQNAGAM